MRRSLRFLVDLIAIGGMTALCALPARAQNKAWVNDLTPDQPRGLELRFGGASAGTRRIWRDPGRNPGACETDARPGGRAAGPLRGRRRESICLPSTIPDIHDPGLEPFPPSRPAVTDMAKEKGEALGIKVKPEWQPPPAADRR